MTNTTQPALNEAFKTNLRNRANKRLLAPDSYPSGYMQLHPRVVLALLDEIAALSAAPAAQPVAPQGQQPAVERLKAAVEGECDGLAITDEQARAILTYLAVAPQGQQPKPLFWYRPIGKDGLYEGPAHNDSVLGKMIRDEKPGEWVPLYTAPPAPSIPAGWISVEDRLPEPETAVLILMRGEYVVAALHWEKPTFEDTFQAYRYWDSPDSLGLVIDWHDVTHWMPLPQLPAAPSAGEQP